jgi:hypothetical protein
MINGSSSKPSSHATNNSSSALSSSAFPSAYISSSSAGQQFRVPAVPMNNSIISNSRYGEDESQLDEPTEQEVSLNHLLF